jgi:hypothetical protein
MATLAAVFAAVAKVLVLITGLVVVYYTARAARRTGDEGLWLLTIGIFLTGVGLFFAGWLSALLGINPNLDIALTSTGSAIGLGLIIYSMFTNPHVHVPP